MNALQGHLKTFFQNRSFTLWLRRIGYFFSVLILLILLMAAGVAYYFNHNKAEIITEINSTINQNISGTTRIGDFEYQFLKGFPNVTLDLKNVTIEDSLFDRHKHQLLNAEKIEVRLPIFHLLRNQIDFQKIIVKNAAVYVYMDSTGYSNTSVFRPKKEKRSEQNSITSFQIKEISMEKVRFVLDNQFGTKLFDFEIDDFSAKPKFENGNWSSKVFIQTKIHSLAFNTQRGSFAKEQLLDGNFDVDYNDNSKKLSVHSNKLKIGKDNFNISSFFNLDPNRQKFQIDIKTNILWKDASALLSPNISEKLNRFSIKKPIQVDCKIDGNLDKKEDPLIVVRASVQNNEVKIPDATIENCSFQGIFTNQFKSDREINNANSAIIFDRFKANYRNIPFQIKSGIITNLDKPTATGKLHSNFDIVKLNDPDNAKWLHFSDGKAIINLDFQFGILDFLINKPLFTGDIGVANASFEYHPKKLEIKKTNLRFKFTQDALIIEEFRFKEQNTIIQMTGRVDNFLNLYYDAPEKMVLNWLVYSPHLDIKQFLALLSNQNKSTVSNKKSISNNFQKVIKKSTVLLDVKADKMVYSKLTATNARVKIKMDNYKLKLSDGFFKMTEGTVSFGGEIVNSAKSYLFSTDVTVENVEIASFLNSFNNFGIVSFTPSNIKGDLFCTSKIEGKIDAKGDLIKKASRGTVDFKIKKGVLVNFKPFVNIGQVAFPFRDVKNVAFSDLSANLVINGEDVTITKMIGSSNVINFDMDGIYSFATNTNLNVTIPLRNSENDLDISTIKERELARYKGIILRLLVVDEAGKIKIKLGKKEHD